jgi:hypothetical protein
LPRWRSEALTELKRSLAQQGFAPEKLQQAHRAAFKALADVISIVKHGPPRRLRS